MLTDMHVMLKLMLYVAVPDSLGVDQSVRALASSPRKKKKIYTKPGSPQNQPSLLSPHLYTPDSTLFLHQVTHTTSYPSLIPSLEIPRDTLPCLLLRRVSGRKHTTCSAPHFVKTTVTRDELQRDVEYPIVTISLHEAPVFEQEKVSANSSLVCCKIGVYRTVSPHFAVVRVRSGVFLLIANGLVCFQALELSSCSPLSLSSTYSTWRNPRHRLSRLSKISRRLSLLK